MTFNEISRLINDEIVKNALGKNITIAEDLSNIIDFGTLVSDMDEDTLKDFSKSFAVGVVRNYFMSKNLKTQDFGLFRDSQEYAGAVQRVKISMDNFEAQDQVIFTLTNGVNYFDGKYYGATPNAKLYTNEEGFDIAWSIPHAQFKSMFKSADEVGSYVALIEETVKNKITYTRTQLSKRVLMGIMESALDGERVINLVTLYNAQHGTTLTSDDALFNADFDRWAMMMIELTGTRMQEVNKKYNDGTIETFMDKSDIRMTLLSEFWQNIKVNLLADTYHRDEIMLSENFTTVPFWQNSSDSIIPTLGTTAEIKLTDGTTEKSYENVVGVIYDYYSGGITQKLDYITNQYIAKGDYTTYFQHVVNRYFVDSTNSAVVFTLN